MSFSKTRAVPGSRLDRLQKSNQIAEATAVVPRRHDRLDGPQTDVLDGAEAEANPPVLHQVGVARVHVRRHDFDAAAPAVVHQHDDARRIVHFAR